MVYLRFVPFLSVLSTTGEDKEIQRNVQGTEEARSLIVLVANHPSNSTESAANIYSKYTLFK